MRFDTKRLKNAGIHSGRWVFYSILCYSLITGCLLLSQVSVAWSEETVLEGGVSTTEAVRVLKLDDFDDPITVTLITPLDSAVNQANDPFEAVLSQDIHWDGQVLPQHTRFKGHIATIQQSKVFGRAGFLSLAVDEIIFPSGDTLQYEAESDSLTRKKLRDRKVEKQRQNRLITLPLSAVGLVTPLPISFGVKAVVNLALEFSDKNSRNDAALKRVGRGLYNATPIATVANLVRKPANANYKPGDSIRLYLPKGVMNGLFTVISEQGQFNVIPASTENEVKVEGAHGQGEALQGADPFFTMESQIQEAATVLGQSEQPSMLEIQRPGFVEGDSAAVFKVSTPQVKVPSDYWRDQHAPSTESTSGEGQNPLAPSLTQPSAQRDSGSNQEANVSLLPK